MKKRVIITVRAGVQNYCLDLDLDEFMESTGIEIDTSEEIDEFTIEEIGDFAINYFSDDETRYHMGIDDNEVRYVGFEILDTEDDDC